MHLNLEVKKYHNFFWLRAIYGARRDKCCIECFNAKKTIVSTTRPGARSTRW